MPVMWGGHIYWMQLELGRRNDHVECRPALYAYRLQANELVPPRRAVSADADTYRRSSGNADVMSVRTLNCDAP